MTRCFICKEKIGLFSGKKRKIDLINEGYKHQSIELMSNNDAICKRCLKRYGDRPEKKTKRKGRTLLSKKYELTKSSVTSKVEVEVFYEVGRVYAIGRSGGLHDFEDNRNFGNYYFAINQKKPKNPEVLGIFEDSLPLEGWNQVKSKQKSENKYILSGPWATEEESKLFFKRTVRFFENKLEKTGFAIVDKSENS